MSVRKVLLVLACCLSVVITVGCATPNAQLARRYVVGRSVENQPLEYVVFGQGRDVILVLAAIHGNEPAGTPLVLQLAKYLREHPPMLQGRRLVLVPAANPNGKAHNE